MSENDNILGNNIKYWRKLYGETLADLAKHLNCASTTVCNYESGIRAPTPEIIKEIAEHYHIPTDFLMRKGISISDLKSLKNITHKILNSDIHLVDYNISLHKLLPLYTSKNAEKDNDFRMGYYFSLKYLQYFPTFKEILEAYSKKNYSKVEELIEKYNFDLRFDSSTILNLSFHFYYSALENNENIPEIFTNILWCIFLLSFINCNDEEKSKDLQEKLETKKLSLQDCMLQNNKKHEDFIKKYNDSLRKLKSTPEWSDVADYYLALRYLFNLINNNYSAVTNSIIGNEMICSYIILGNSVASKHMGEFYSQFVNLQAN